MLERNAFRVIDGKPLLRRVGGRKLDGLAVAGVVNPNRFHGLPVYPGRCALPRMRARRVYGAVRVVSTYPVKSILRSASNAPRYHGRYRRELLASPMRALLPSQ